MITNPKIARKKTDIARTETRLAEVRARLRQQREELTKLEDDEIVAMFRSEVITEDDFAALLRSRRENAEQTEELEQYAESADGGGSPKNREEG
jgi:hypothetical protein